MRAANPLESGMVGISTRVAGGLAALALGLTACGGGDAETVASGSEAGSSDTTTTTTIKWATQPGNAVDIPLLMADQEGVLAENGLAFERLSVTGGNANQIAAVVSGSADFFIGTVDSVSAAVQAGQKIKIFCGLVPTTPLPVMARPELNLKTFQETGDWAETIQQLKGLKIGVPARGSAYELRTTAILESAGVQATDVTFVPIGIGPAVVAGLKAGQIDAMLAYGFLESQLPQAGLAETLVDAAEDGPDAFKDAFSSALIASEPWLEENSDAAAALCDTVEGANEVVMDPASRPALEAMLAKDFGVLPDQMDAAVEFTTDDYYGPEVPEEGVEKVLDILRKGGAIKETPPITYDAIVDLASS